MIPPAPRRNDGARTSRGVASKTLAGGDAQGRSPMGRQMRARNTAPASHFSKAAAAAAPQVESSSGSSSNIRVCVRVRPLGEREEGDEICVQEAGPQSIELIHSEDESKRIPGSSPTSLKSPGGSQNRAPRLLTFTYDRCFLDAPQDDVYKEVGVDMLRSVIDGFHGCLFAYGQTGSGKSYTVMGSNTHGDGRGILPRYCEDMFKTIGAAVDTSYQVSVAYLEIYNEKARDLLRPAPETRGAGEKAPNLEIRQHPKFGVFVPDLTENAVASSDGVVRLLDFGNKIRVVGCS